MPRCRWAAGPLGRTVYARTIADCVCIDNRIVHEWLVRDQGAIARQLGLDERSLAQRWLNQSAGQTPPAMPPAPAPYRSFIDPGSPTPEKAAPRPSPCAGGFGLFRDDGLASALLAGAGLHIHWMAQASTAQLLIVLYGIWHVAPFAFIVLDAGLQSVSKDALKAASIDGATRWQLLRFVTLPHLMPLVVFITLIHLMDAYRVFEPVLVLTQGTFTTSVPYLTNHILLNEANPYKASAAAVLTLAGIAVLLVPLLVKTWREQRAGQ